MLLAQAELELAVTPAEEQAELTIFSGTDVRRISVGAPVYLLVVLARARGAHEIRSASETGRARRSDQGGDGWLGVDDVCREIGGDTNLLNVHLHRVRERLGALGFADATHVVERRKGRLRLSLDPARIRIVTRG